MLVLADFLAGWFGGTIGLLVGHPADTVKVRQQVLNDNFRHIIKTTYKYEGLRGFYKGLLSPLLTIGASNSVFFGTYANTMNVLEPGAQSDSQQLKYVFVSGIVAGFVQVLFTCPIELVKTIQQSTTGGGAKEWNTHREIKQNGTVDLIKYVFKERGFRGYYRGLLPMMFRDVPAAAFYITFYEVMVSDGKNQTAWRQLLAGGFSGVGSWMLTIPFDVIKSKMQSDDPKNPLYKGMLDCIQKSYKAGGPQIFVKGFWITIARAFPVNAAVFFGYETAMKVLRRVFSN